MQIKEFSQQLEILEKTSSRNEMTVILADFLRKLDKHEIRPVMYMLIGRIVPTYIPIEFNFSTKLLIRSLAEAFKMPVDGVKKMYGEKGDIGLVGAEMARQDSNKNGANTTINEIYDLLYELAISGGKGSQEIKKQIYIDLIKKFDPISVKFISRIITGDLRLGLSDKTILDAFSWIISGDKSHKVVLEQAYGVRADIGEIAELVLSGKMDELDKLEIVPGTPVASKLVQREKSVDAVFERLGDCYAQPKYDGLRTQIHFSKKDFAVAVKVSKSAKSSCMENYAFGFVEQKGEKEHVRIFSRNMEPLTDMFPDIVKVFENSKFDSIVLDGEAIGVDPKTGKFIAFQETSKRRRKYSVGEKAKSTPVKVFVFDVLCFDGKDLTKTGLRERLEILNKLEKFFAQQNVLAISNTQLVKSTEQLDKIFRDALDKGLEGIIAKDIESKYIPGTRTYDWIKLKANIEQGLIDTVDCVVLGYYYGRGVRAKFGVGAFLVGVYNKKKERFETVAKVGSGVKDEQWPDFVKQVNEIRVESVPKNVYIKKELMPDVLCEPKIVVVVEADEITKSGNHTAGMDEGGKGNGKDAKGFSLRFPRLKEWGRVDKKPEDVTSVEEIEGMV